MLQKKLLYLFMKLDKRQIIIEPGDSPLVIDEALQSSFSLLSAYLRSEDDSRRWFHKARNAQETLGDGFSIIGDTMYKSDGEARLFLAPNDLEFVLVAYGCELLESPTLVTDDTIVAINGLLASIDSIKKTN